MTNRASDQGAFPAELGERVFRIMDLTRQSTVTENVRRIARRRVQRLVLLLMLHSFENQARS